MDKSKYEKLKMLFLLFGETDIVCTSNAFEEDWKDENADDNGWT
jgi:hypothetical protein